MNPSTIQPSVMSHTLSALRYRLVQGPARLEPLQILDSRSVRWHGWTATFFVLGASHAVCLADGSQQITEMLTCLPLQEPGPMLLDLPGDRTHAACAEAAGLVCRIRLSRFDLTSGSDLQGRYPARCRLGHVFPAREGGPAPETRIGWILDGPGLAVETIHTYPDEGRGVRSHSVFVLAGGELP